MRNIASLLVAILGSVFFAGAQTADMQSSRMEGVVTKSGSTEPVPDAVVTFGSESGRPSLTVITGADGKFTASGLVPGRYEVNVSKPGFIRRTGGLVSVSLEPGQRLVGLRIEVMPTAAVSGRVLDDAGEPAGGIELALVQPRYDNGRKVLTACNGTKYYTKTNELGDFRLYGLEPGTYYLVTRSCISAPQYYGGGSDPSDALPIVLTAGEELRSIVFRLQQQDLYQVRFRAVAALPDSAAQAPLRFVHVVRKSRNGLAVDEMNGMDSPRALVTLPPLRRIADHDYFVTGLARGSYEIYYAGDINGSSVGHFHVDVVDRDVDAGTIVLKGPVLLPGRISAGESLTALDPSLLNLRITFRALDGVDIGGLGSRTPRGVKPDPDGTFKISLISRSYRIEIANLPSNKYIATAKYGSRDVLSDGLILDGGDVVGPLELRIETGGTVQGLVQDAKDLPVKGARVVLVPTVDRRGNLLLFKSGFTDQDGAFSISGVAPGEYSVLAWEDVETGAWLSADFLKRFEAHATRVNVLGLSNTRVQVIPTGKPD